MTAPLGPGRFPRVVAGYDELGYPLLAHDCPFCGATALIVNEWGAVECLTCSWREFGPDSPRAAGTPPRPRYPEVTVTLHAKSAVISAGWAAQALAGWGIPRGELAAFMRDVSAAGYAGAEDVIAEWVTVTGRLTS